MLSQSGLPRWLDTSLAIAICLAALAVTWMRYDNVWPADLSAVYIAAKLFASGDFGAIYAVTDGNLGHVDHPLWIKALVDIGDAEKVTYPYVYPPLWAALASWVSDLPAQDFFHWVFALELGAVALSIWAAWRLFASVISPLIWVGLTLPLLMMSMIPTLGFLHYQPQFFVTALILLAVERQHAGAALAAGGALALAASIKLSPAILLILFIAARDWRAVAAFLGFGLGLAGLSFALAGPTLHWELIAALRDISGQVIVSKLNGNLESIIHQTATILGAFGEVERRIVSGEWIGDRVAEPGWLTALTLCLLAGVTVLFLRQRAWGDTGPVRAARLGALSGLATLLAPVAWAHHALPLLFLAPGLVALYPPRWGFLLIALWSFATWSILFRPLVFASTSVIVYAYILFAAILSLTVAFIAAIPRH